MKNLTDITIILDRSGSMGSIKTATIEGVNSFLNDQKKDELKSLVSFMQFDDIYETVYVGKNIDNVLSIQLIINCNHNFRINMHSNSRSVNYLA